MLRWVPALLIRKRSFIRAGAAGESKQPKLHHSRPPPPEMPAGPCHTQSLFENPCNSNSQTDTFLAGVVAPTKSYYCAFLYSLKLLPIMFCLLVFRKDFLQMCHRRGSFSMELSLGRG